MKYYKIYRLWIDPADSFYESYGYEYYGSTCNIELVNQLNKIKIPYPESQKMNWPLCRLGTHHVFKCEEVKLLESLKDVDIDFRNEQ